MTRAGTNSKSDSKQREKWFRNPQTLMHSMAMIENAWFRRQPSKHRAYPALSSISNICMIIYLMLSFENQDLPALLQRYPLANEASTSKWQ